MYPFTLRQLQIFVTIAEMENLTAASRHLHLSPATSSEALGNLEALLGEPLFDRSDRRLRLNPNGRHFLKNAKAFLAQADALYHRHIGRPRLILGASVTVGNYILPPSILSIARLRPDIQIELTIRNTEGIVQLLLERSIEAAVVEGKVSNAQIETIAWIDDELVFIAPPGHRFGAGASAQDMALAAWVLRETGSGTRETFDALARSWPETPDPILVAGGNDVIKQAVAAGLGISCISLASVTREIASGELIRIPWPQRISRTLTFARLHDCPHSEALGAFMDCMELGTRYKERQMQAESPSDKSAAED